MGFSKSYFGTGDEDVELGIEFLACGAALGVGMRWREYDSVGKSADEEFVIVGFLEGFEGREHVGVRILGISHHFPEKELGVY